MADQFNKLEEVPQSDQVHHTIQKFPGMMEEVVGFIQKWLEHWTRMYNLSGMDQLPWRDNVRSTQASAVHLQGGLFVIPVQL